MIQGGCPLGTGTGGPGHTIKGEFKSNGFDNPLKHELGVLSMARTMIPNSAGSQFFIMVASAPHLDGQYAAFGKVIGDESFKVLEELNNARTEFVSNAFADFPYPFITIKTIERI
jgi:peptidyl-prolyl cis-trans isomerase B (cyclophilin B)